MIRDLVEKLTKEASDQGRLIEVGWLSLQLAAIPENASQVQIDSMREAFFAGAQHLFSSIMTVLDPESEPTQADLNRMAMIQSELEEFIKQYKSKHNL
jgi:hypothetical protein